MRRNVFMIGLLLIPFICGCFDDDKSLPFIRRNPFGLYRPPRQEPLQLKLTSATMESTNRARLIAQKIALDNELKTVGLRPVLHVVGVPQLAVFHRGTQELFLTEGLVNQCKTDDQLAAVIALEMGKMVSEREALAHPSARERKQLPPIDVPVGHELGGSFGPADGTRLAELARFEKETKARNALAALPPRPSALATSYLKKAGYQVNALEAVNPLLKKAHQNVQLERQLKGSGSALRWQPVSEKGTQVPSENGIQKPVGE